MFACLVAFVIVVWLVVKTPNRNSNVDPDKCRRLVAALTVSGTVYLLFMITSSFFATFDPLDDRLLAPLYVPLLLLAAYLLPMGSDWSRQWSMVKICALIWLLCSASWSLTYVVYRAIDGGGGYNTRAWRASRIVEEVRGKSSSEFSFSSDPSAAYALFGARTSALENIQGDDRGQTVLWLAKGYGSDASTAASFPEDEPNALPEGVSLHAEFLAEDGGLYTIRSSQE